MQSNKRKAPKLRTESAKKGAVRRRQANQILELAKLLPGCIARLNVLNAAVGNAERDLVELRRRMIEAERRLLAWEEKNAR